MEKERPTAMPNKLSRLAEEIFGQTYLLTQRMKEIPQGESSSSDPASTQSAIEKSTEIERAQNNIVGLSQRLVRLIRGPHGYLHEYVSSNWDCGALYALLEFDVLEKIPLGGEEHISQLAEQSCLPEDKLLNILRLAACEEFIQEVSEGSFRHTEISEELIKDKGFKAFIGFQLFETRVASAHLADSLKWKNEYWTGMPAFQYAWGTPMYEWHRSHPEKASRFKLAMQSVSHSLDPGNKLFCEWFRAHGAKDRKLVVDIGGLEGQTAAFLAEQFPELYFEVRDGAQNSLDKGRRELSPHLGRRITFTQKGTFEPQPIEDSERVFAYVVRNVLWNIPEEDCIRLLQSFAPVLERSPQTVLLVNELLSPAPGTFDPHIEKAYRRRDVTLMTMHNAKQRTESEWRSLIVRASPHFRAHLTPGFTSHSSRGLWEVRWERPSSLS